MFRERRVVDNRVFLLGLDGLYRTAMKRHEAGELLEGARIVASELNVAPADGPIEGYYTETPDLTEYFRLMRALQNTPGSERSLVARLPEFRRLEEVTSAPLFGRATDVGMLLPTGCDPLTQALQYLQFKAWTVDALVGRANQVVRDTDDYSLVGLAAWTRDPVVLAATRESVVLYAGKVARAAVPPRPKYVWAVDEELARRTARFIKAFNRLFGEELPEAKARNAKLYWDAKERNEILGRCVNIGSDASAYPVRYYHWAIAPGEVGLEVEEFWDQELWTTEMYRRKLMGNLRSREAGIASLRDR